MMKALAKYADEPQKLAEWASNFYANHAEYVSREMQIGEKRAQEFADSQRSRLMLSVKDNCAGALIKELETVGADSVVDFIKEAA